MRAASAAEAISVAKSGEEAKDADEVDVIPLLLSDAAKEGCTFVCEKEPPSALACIEKDADALEGSVMLPALLVDRAPWRWWWWVCCGPGGGGARAR